MRKRLHTCRDPLFTPLSQVHTDMRHWEGIVPCGLEGRQIASVKTLRAAQGLPEIEPQELMGRAAAHAVSHFGDVFAVQMRAPVGGDRTLAEHESRGGSNDDIRRGAGWGAGVKVGR
jgi:hypothetical protein